MCLKAWQTPSRCTPTHTQESSSVSIKSWTTNISSFADHLQLLPHISLWWFQLHNKNGKPILGSQARSGLEINSPTCTLNFLWTLFLSSARLYAAVLQNITPVREPGVAGLALSQKTSIKRQINDTSCIARLALRTEWLHMPPLNTVPETKLNTVWKTFRKDRTMTAVLPLVSVSRL